MELATLQLGGRHDGPHVLLTGGVHGDEFELHGRAPDAGRPARIPDDPRADHPRPGRERVGVPPRPTRWGRRPRPRPDLSGRPDGSTTEQVAHALAHLIRNADAYVDLHTGAPSSRSPPHRVHAPSRPDVLDRQRRMSRAFGLPIVWEPTRASKAAPSQSPATRTCPRSMPSTSAAEDATQMAFPPMFKGASTSWPT